MADTITTDLGPVTAYADAVAHGYTGTREDFGKLLAGAGKNLEDAVDASNAAKAAAENAENAAQTAADAAGTAGQAAGVAGSAAEVASTSADEAAQSAETAETAKQSAENAAKKAVEAKTGAENALKDADTAKDAASGYADAATESATAAAASATNAAASAKSASNAAQKIEDSAEKIEQNADAVSQLKEDIENKMDFELWKDTVTIGGESIIQYLNIPIEEKIKDVFVVCNKLLISGSCSFIVQVRYHGFDTSNDATTIRRGVSKDNNIMIGFETFGKIRVDKSLKNDEDSFINRISAFNSRYSVSDMYKSNIARIEIIVNNNVTFLEGCELQIYIRR